MNTKAARVCQGAAAGLAGGLAASWIMQQVVAAARPYSVTVQRSTGDTHEEEHADPKEELASKASLAVRGKLAGPALRRAAKPLVHYGFGGVTGGLYGAAAALSPTVAAAWGLPFGAAVWLAADEAGLTLMGLSRGTTVPPPGTHVVSLGTHLIYGAVTELVRRTLAA